MLEKFLETILTVTDTDVDYVFCALDQPPSPSTPWPPITESSLLKLAEHPDNRAFYISTMLSRRDEYGKYRNKQSAFAGLFMVVLDDIGTKVDPTHVKPTYKIESSEGNFQYGYLLDTPITNRRQAELFVSAIYETSLTDGGGKMVNKFVRLPAGINGKETEDGSRNRFQVRLAELNEDVTYEAQKLLEEFGLDLNIGETNLPDITQLNSIILTDDDYRRVKDPVTQWLLEQDLIYGERDDWIDIKCPWHAGHSDGNVTAGYSPVGQGKPEFRAFNCFHDHCTERTTKDFLSWVKEQGGPFASVFDPIAPMVSRYVLLEYSSEVADTWATAESKYPIVSLASFRAAHKQYIRGEKGKKNYYGELWLEHPDTIRTKGRIFDPTSPPIAVIDDVPHFNTYRAPSHPMVAGEPTTYLEHIEWMLPDADERELFHNWVAQKLQYPESRSYAIIMVADKAEGEAGDVYGTGRSTIGDILGKVFQSGVVKVDLSDISGKGDSQSTYNEWIDESMICIVEETKEELDTYTSGHANYEGLKKIIDVRSIPNVRVKPKYGRIYYTTVFTNFLFFSNHSDAIQLPELDRRFAVLTNNKFRRTFEEYAELQRFLRSRDDIARLYRWYMERNIDTYDHVYPPMTAAKQVMIHQGVSTLDEVWQCALTELEGSIVTKRQLLDACDKVCDGDLKLQSKASAMARARWRKLKEVSPGWRLKANNQLNTIRIIKNHDKVLSAYHEKDHDWLRDELNKNESEQIQTLRRAFNE